MSFLEKKKGASEKVWTMSGPAIRRCCLVMGRPGKDGWEEGQSGGCSDWSGVSLIGSPPVD